MFRLRRTIPWRSLSRRLRAACFLLCYLAATIGLPMPALARKGAAERFPCENNPCGCQSAVQCWTSCCCYTVEEHWAWAWAHQIEPPSYARRPADDGWNSRPQRDQEQCQSAERSCSCCKQHTDVEKPKERGFRWVNAVGSLRCQGVHPAGLFGTVSTPPPAVVEGDFSLAPTDSIPLSAFAVLTRSTPPLDPPPRLRSF